MKTEEKIKTPNGDWHFKEGQRSLSDHVSSRGAKGIGLRAGLHPCSCTLYPRALLATGSLFALLEHLILYGTDARNTHYNLFLSKPLNEIRFTETQHSCF